MDSKKVYDMVMEEEKSANLMHIEQDNRERALIGNQDYLSVAVEAGKVFNRECEVPFDASATDEREFVKVKSKVKE